ncbi:hypothetical protein LINPERHAP2_LOCUS34205 [Linum perenne]
MIITSQFHNGRLLSMRMPRSSRSALGSGFRSF